MLASAAVVECLDGGRRRRQRHHHRGVQAHGRPALDRTYAATPTLGNWNGF